MLFWIGKIFDSVGAVLLIISQLMVDRLTDRDTKYFFDPLASGN